MLKSNEDNFLEVERLVYVCPNIENELTKSCWSDFCISPIKQTRPWMKCCYISLKNLLIELIEITDVDLAKDFVFLDEWRSAKIPSLVATGLKTNNLEICIKKFLIDDVKIINRYEHQDIMYPSGYKHRSIMIENRWSDKAIYITEYDLEFWKYRKSNIQINTNKKFFINVKKPKLNKISFKEPFYFKQNISNIIQLEIEINLSKINFFSDWIQFICSR
jgi:hypothetical protein